MCDINKQSGSSASEIKTSSRQFFKNPISTPQRYFTKSLQLQQLKFLPIPTGLLKVTSTYKPCPSPLLSYLWQYHIYLKSANIKCLQSRPIMFAREMDLLLCNIDSLHLFTPLQGRLQKNIRGKVSGLE